MASELPTRVIKVGDVEIQQNRRAQSHGSLPPEPVEERENVGSVRPEDYPLADRQDGDATGNRGRRASRSDGPVRGSGSGAGGGGAPEDYDDDPQAGGGSLNFAASGAAPEGHADGPQGGGR